MKNKTKRAVITGYGKEEFLNLKREKKRWGCCYWCRKREGGESVFHTKDGVGVEKVVLFPVVQRWKKIEMVYLVCRECYLGFAGVIKAVEKDRSIIEEGGLEKGG